MKQSFKLHLFIRLFVITLLIIGTNRMIAQHFLTKQLRDSLHQEMGQALISCVGDFERRPQFLSCYSALRKGDVRASVSDFYLLCAQPSGAAGPSAIAACPRGIPANFWSNTTQTIHDQIDASRGVVDGEDWFAVRFTGQPNGPEVWMRQNEVDLLVEQMWEFRDRNLYLVLPWILVLLGLMTFYMAHVLMRPIVLIEANLSKVNASNLGSPILLKAPYREFVKLVRVFEDLQERLNDSFIKARRFASDASHELRTPLTILRGHAEQLIHDLPTGSEAQVQMRLMGDEVERLIDITEKLLLLSRADSNSLFSKLSEVNLSALLTGLVEDNVTFQSNLKLTHDIAPDVIWTCDKTLAHQLVQNLYSNAVKYNLPQGWIHVSLASADGYFELTMTNPTHEVPLDLVERAFERFYRGEASHTRNIDGLGLGLSICLEIAKLHQGTLTMRIENDKTVTMTLRAPLTRTV